jgi:hypothetical protein
MQCHICGRLGHFADQCDGLTAEEAFSKDNGPGGGGGGGGVIDASKHAAVSFQLLHM